MTNLNAASNVPAFATSRNPATGELIATYPFQTPSEECAGRMGPGH